MFDGTFVSGGGKGTVVHWTFLCRGGESFVVDGALVCHGSGGLLTWNAKHTGARLHPIYRADQLRHTSCLPVPRPSILLLSADCIISMRIHSLLAQTLQRYRSPENNGNISNVHGRR